MSAAIPYTQPQLVTAKLRFRTDVVPAQARFTLRLDLGGMVRTYENLSVTAVPKIGVPLAECPALPEGEIVAYVGFLSRRAVAAQVVSVECDPPGSVKCVSAVVESVPPEPLPLEDSDTPPLQVWEAP